MLTDLRTIQERLEDDGDSISVAYLQMVIDRIEAAGERGSPSRKSKDIETVDE